VSAKAALALLAALLLLAGCGRAAQPKDPFVGTWRQWPGHGPNAQTPVVITKSGSSYVATVVFWGGASDKPASPRPVVPITMTRHSDVLTGTFMQGTQTLRARIIYLPNSGHLTFTNSRTPTGPFNRPDVFVKVSEGTVYPTTP
jgi:hypothetical protein